MIMYSELEREKSSFRDLSGFVFKKDNVLYRQINECYKSNYEKLMSSGLYDELVSQNLLVSHEEVTLSNVKAYKIIKPKYIEYVSYPYEWSFSMLKDAGLLTLNIQEKAIEYGMSLKDASSYNVQFDENAKPVFIDTLSFEQFEETSWKAYGQFCRHFLAPLLLMSFVDMRCQNLLKSYIDGIPLDLVGKMLPLKCKFNLSILMHIYWHSEKINQFEKTCNSDLHKIKLSKSQHLALIDNLKSLISSLKFPMKTSEWGEYYDFTNYSEKSFLSKKDIVTAFIDKVNPKSLWDLGGNIGTFTRLASEKGIPSVVFDVDYVSVEKNYLQIKKNKENNLLPLVLDLANPSPAIGWANEERKTFFERGNADMVLMLALIHHLYFSNNLSFDKVAEFVSKFAKTLVIEFVPKEDSQVKFLTLSKSENYDYYNIENFEIAFSKFFDIKEKFAVEESGRILYLMKGKD